MSANLKQNKLGLCLEQWLSQESDKEELVSCGKTGNGKSGNLDGQHREEEDNSGMHRPESFIESLYNSLNSILNGINSINSYSNRSSCSSRSGGSYRGR
ncbi:hypothetical protein Bca101_018685 [Brassica carinata]